MTLVRTQTRPQRMVDLVNSNLFRDIDRMFNEATNASYTNYPADLYETDDKLVLELAVPGLRAEDLDISVEDGQLTVSGKALSEHKEEGERRYWLQSISRSEFSRSLRLPKSVDVENISANVQNGVLLLTMPKVAEAQVKKIEIQAS